MRESVHNRRTTDIRDPHGRPTLDEIGQGGGSITWDDERVFVTRKHRTEHPGATRSAAGATTWALWR